MGRVFDPARKRKGSEGFTLLEALVALALATLFIAVLIRAFGFGLFHGSLPGERLAATTLARALLADVRTMALGPDVTRDGITEGYRWRIETRAVPLPPRASGARNPPRATAPAKPPSATTPAVDPPRSGGETTATAGRTDAQPNLTPSQILDLLHVMVEVVTPSGRRDRLEGLIAQSAVPAALER
ncbi:hypothetical protein ASF60_14925 [Methylobacterium sp. Leaf113]|nr:hypothetical protein ASF60_14925 [Methylobacterium sp. Leaf113]